TRRTLRASAAAVALIQGEPPGQVAKYPADAVLVQPGPRRDHRQRQTLALEPQEFVVLGRTQGQHPLPQVVGLRQFAGLWLARRGQCIPVAVEQRPLVLQGVAVPAVAVDEAVARGADEESPQVLRAGEALTTGAEAVQ